MATLNSRNLERLAKRAMLGWARTGGIASNGSGDYVIALSTAKECRIPHKDDRSVQNVPSLRRRGHDPFVFVRYRSYGRGDSQFPFFYQDHDWQKWTYH